MEWPSDITMDPKEAELKEQQTLMEELTVGPFPRKGPQQAPVTITIFSDFQCPYCRQAAEILNRDILPIESNPVRLVYRYLPLPVIHAWSRPAAEMAACVYMQNSETFWKLHDFFFSNQMEFTQGNIHDQVVRFLRETGSIDDKQFEKCIVEHNASDRVDQDVEFAAEHGITVTPTIFINGVRRNGVVSPDEMRRLIREQSLPKLKAAK